MPWYFWEQQGILETLDCFLPIKFHIEDPLSPNSFPVLWSLDYSSHVLFSSKEAYSASVAFFHCLDYWPLWVLRLMLVLNSFRINIVSCVSILVNTVSTVGVCILDDLLSCSWGSSSWCTVSSWLAVFNEISMKSFWLALSSLVVLVFQKSF